ncbi:MAG TPA: glycogen synthase GlgA [Verrucomicrobiae bacterium]|nr:glycogen synthase GlgA [Verrucomicrobiae bacterium]
MPFDRGGFVRAEAETCVQATAGEPARPMRVLFVASEYFPLAKTGGLGDVTGALPRALRGLGVDARVIIPAYRSALAKVSGLGRVETIEILPGRMIRIVEASVTFSRVPVYLVVCPELFDRPGGPYVDESSQDWADNAERFAVLAHAAVHLAMGRGGFPWQPDVVHAHDWQAGLVPLLLRFAPGPKPASIFTIHNAAFPGRFGFDQVRGLALPEEALGTDGAEFYGDVSFLKAGIYYADKLTTVSPTYARELCTPEFGGGFDGLLRSRQTDLVGILNGIDDELWNPATDKHLAHNYADPDCGGKQACKSALQRELGLPESPRNPLAIFASRLTEQKMADVVLNRISGALESAPDLQFALVGQGDRKLEQGFREIAQAHPNRIAVRLEYSEPLAHRLHAGGDLLLHGSRYEPCGLVQMYSMRYGTVPLVRNTGGLADSVNDADGASSTPTGFVFDQASGDAMMAAMMRGVDVYRRSPDLWRGLQRNGMRRDNGWQKSASRHHALYLQQAEAAFKVP